VNESRLCLGAEGASCVRVCPYCQNDAPVVYRGMVAYCTACGAVRPPVLPTKSINLAGQPSKVGGVVAKVFGWLVLFFGLTAATVIGALFQAIWPAGIVGWALGIPMALVSLAMGISLLVGGKSLAKSGQDTEDAVREKAIQGLASTHGGILTKDDVARALSVTVLEGDAYLTHLAKTKPDDIAVDVDDSGNVLFRFRAIAARPRVGVRVDVARGTGPRVVGSGASAEDQLWAQAEAEAEEAARATSPRGASSRTR